MSCSIVAVLTTKDNNATNFIRKKYSAAYVKYMENAGLSPAPHQRIYSFVRNGEFSRFDEQRNLDRSCTCYICEKRGIKFVDTDDSMKKWLEVFEESESDSAISAHQTASRKLLFPFFVPQKNFSTIQPEVLACDECIYQIQELQFDANHYFESDGHGEFNDDDDVVMDNIPSDTDGFNIQIDSCVQCGEEYMVTPEEYFLRVEKNLLGRCYCDECLNSAGFDNEAYIQKKTCPSCLEETPYDLSLTGYIAKYVDGACNTCKGHEEKEDQSERKVWSHEPIEDMEDDLPFKTSDIPSSLLKDIQEQVEADKAIQKEKGTNYWCKEFGNYFIGQLKGTQVAYIIFVPPKLNIPRLSFNIALTSEVFVDEEETQYESIHHDCIEDMVFVFDKDHHNTYAPDFDGQYRCMEAAMKYCHSARRHAGI